MSFRQINQNGMPMRSSSRATGNANHRSSGRRKTLSGTRKAILCPDIGRTGSQ